MRLVTCLLFAALSLPAHAGRQVSVPDSFRTCERDAECTKVDIDCNECCGQDAIHRGSKEAFAKRFTETCRDYKGPVCDCVARDASPRCVKRRCRMVPAAKGKAP